jgi:hypothetical protein
MGLGNATMRAVVRLPPVGQGKARQGCKENGLSNTMGKRNYVAHQNDCCALYIRRAAKSLFAMCFLNSAWQTKNAQQ